MGNNGEELKAFNVRDGYGILVRSPLILKSLSLPGERLNWRRSLCHIGDHSLVSGAVKQTIAFSDLLEKLAIAPENVAYAAMISSTGR